MIKITKRKLGSLIMDSYIMAVNDIGDGKLHKGIDMEEHLKKVVIQVLKDGNNTGS
jgi:hypothetical protein